MIQPTGPHSHERGIDERFAALMTRFPTEPRAAHDAARDLTRITRLLTDRSVSIEETNRTLCALFAADRPYDNRHALSLLATYVAALSDTRAVATTTLVDNVASVVRYALTAVSSAPQLGQPGQYDFRALSAIESRVTALAHVPGKIADVVDILEPLEHTFISGARDKVTALGLVLPPLIKNIRNLGLCAERPAYDLWTRFALPAERELTFRLENRDPNINFTGLYAESDNTFTTLFTVGGARYWVKFVRLVFDTAELATENRGSLAGLPEPLIHCSDQFTGTFCSAVCNAIAAERKGTGSSEFVDDFQRYWDGLRDVVTCGGSVAAYVKWITDKQSH